MQLRCVHSGAVALSLLAGGLPACAIQHTPPSDRDAGDATTADVGAPPQRDAMPRDAAIGDGTAPDSELEYGDDGVHCGSALQHGDPSCDAPPPAGCRDDATWVQPSATGTCRERLCEYPVEKMTQCFGGCDSQGCRLCPGDPPSDPTGTFPLAWSQETELSCYSFDLLQDPTMPPDLPVDFDGGTAPGRRCPASDALVWGPVGEGACNDRPLCPQPQAATENAEGECCYFTYFICGV